MGRHRRDRNNQRGVIIIWLGLFLLMMLGFVAIGIDLAKLMTGRTQLQNAADAAALAGASAIDPTTGIIVAATAVTRAQQTGLQNKAFINDAQPVVVDAGDVIVTANTVQVTTRREGANSIITHFANVLGIPNLQMTATATAKVDTARIITCGILPLAAAPLPGQPDFVLGTVYVLKVPGGTGSSGDYGAVDLPTCLTEGPCAGMPSTGASTYKCLLANGYCCPITVGQTLNTESGNMSGPTKEGIKARFDKDTVKEEDITYAQYLAKGGNGSRLVVVPITTTPVGWVTIQGFGTFFLRNIPGSGNNSEVDGEFVLATVAGTGGGGGSGPITFAIRLIK